MKRLLAAALLFTAVSCGSKGDYVVQPTPANTVTVTFAGGSNSGGDRRNGGGAVAGADGTLSGVHRHQWRNAFFVFPADQARNAVAFYMVDTAGAALDRISRCQYARAEYCRHGAKHFGLSFRGRGCFGTHSR